jgi:hypothetical protein
MVPPNIRCRKIVIFNRIGVPLNSFKGLKGATNIKKLKNTVLHNIWLTLQSSFFVFGSRDGSSFVAQDTKNREMSLP